MSVAVLIVWFYVGGGGQFAHIDMPSMEICLRERDYMLAEYKKNRVSEPLMLYCMDRK